jgi:hypothetical protein
MQVPAGYEGDFLWVEYLKKTKSQAAPLSLFLHKDEYKHAFKVILSHFLSSVSDLDPRRAKMTTKVGKNKGISCFEVLDVLF